MFVQKLVREGFVAVVIHGDYGRGFYSNIYKEAALFDPVVVRSLENMEDGLGTEGLEEYLWETYRWDGNIERLEVEWVRQGRAFIVDDYDGFEHLQFRDEAQWLSA